MHLIQQYRYRMIGAWHVPQKEEVICVIDHFLE